jgi:hypothetical protein
MLITEGKDRGFLVLLCTGAFFWACLLVRGAEQPPPNPAPLFQQYCFTCHGDNKPMAGVSLMQLTAKGSVGEAYQTWKRVAAALEQNRMPPKGMPQPAEEQRRQMVAWIRSELETFIAKHAGDPGKVTVRRLTSAEYAYSVQDLTGLTLDTGIEPSSDSVGGEGFTNFGDVQFMQDANLQRYLEAAKMIAEHAVIGAGPLEFYSDPGKTGFELSAISRIKEIYQNNGFRTVSGEGGFPFGLERYTNAFFVAWEYRNRAALGEPNATIASLAGREGITARFAEHVWQVMNRKDLGYPLSEVANRWGKLAAPGSDAKASAKAARASCEEVQKYLTGWPGWLFSRGDQAAGGAGDESPLVFNDKSLAAETTHHFRFNTGFRRPGRGGRGAAAAGPTKVYLVVSTVPPNPDSKAVIVWRNATIAFQKGFAGRAGAAATPAADGDVAEPETPTPATPVKPGAALPKPPVAAPARGLPAAGPAQPLRSVVSEEIARKLNFGVSPDGTPIGANDFASASSLSFEVKLPEGMTGLEFQVDATLGQEHDQVFKVVFSERPDGGTARGIPVHALIGDMAHPAYQKFKSGVMELATTLPPNSNGEPTPADKDPIPLPFDSTYNVPEHDAFVNDVKYLREDRFVVDHILDDATRKRLENAWSDLYSSFAYHQNYLALLAAHYKLDFKGKTIATLTEADLSSLPAEPQKYIRPVLAGYKAVMAQQAAAAPHHLENCLDFASRAWRRPLTEREKQNLRAFYDRMLTVDSDHRKAIRAVIARILVSPAFLYRAEQGGTAQAGRATITAAAATSGSAVKPVSNWEMAGRLSFFLWSSVPDDELRRAAAAGELTDTQQLGRQVKRMLADPKARRLSTEFFGQWLGFYHFDQFRGVDTGRFPEFTDEVKSSMYDEAVSFFEHVVRKDRPVREILFADYDFLNKPLAKFYGINKDVASKGPVELVEGAGEFHRGGMLRLGAVLTATSAPLRTSPVKRGDWVLRRILGTPTPPPPADAGSIPADDKLFSGLSIREKLQAHKRNATCANCHARIDPLGFPLEHYDSTGRWREQYVDGKTIWDQGELSDKTEIAGVNGLLEYLKTKEDQVRRTLSTKLLGYALGRTVQASDQPLIDRMVSAGGDATFAQLASEIVTSPQFRNRTAADDAPPARTKSQSVGAP